MSAMDDQRLQRMERRDGALFRKVGDVIAAEPERYNQGQWIVRGGCGTTACVAGHTLLLHPEFDPLHKAESLARIGLGRLFSTAAARMLGLSDGEDGCLFDASWKPAGDPATPLHERVRDALYALADGATVEEVTA